MLKSSVIILLACFLLSPLTAADATDDSRLLTDYIRALQLLQGQSLSKGEALLKQLITRHEHPFLSVMLADLYLEKRKQPGQALAVIDACLAKYPDNQRAMEQKVRILIALEDYAAAIPIYRQLLVMEPANSGYLRALGKLLFQQKRFPEARKLLMEYYMLRAPSQPQDEFTYFILADCYEKEGEWSLAAFFYKQSLRLQPLYKYAVERLERLYDQRQNHVDACRFYGKMAEKSSTPSMYYDLLIDHLIEEGSPASLHRAFDLLQDYAGVQSQKMVRRKQAFTLYYQKKYAQAQQIIAGFDYAADDENFMLLAFNVAVAAKLFDQADNWLHILRVHLSDARHTSLAAYLCLQKGDKQAGLDLLARKAQSHPQDVASLIEYARATYDYDRPERALKLLYAGIGRQKDPRLLKLYALFLLEQQQTEKAKDVLRIMLKQEADADAYRFGLRLSLMANDRDLYRQVVERIIARADGEADYLLAGESYMVLADEDKALSVLRVGLQSYPDSRELRLFLSYVLFQKGWLKENEIILRQLHEQHPFQPNICNSLAYSLVTQKKDLKQANELLRWALQVEPVNPAFLDSMGWLHFMQGDCDKALPYMEEALRLSAPDGELYDHMARVLTCVNQPERALKYMRLAVEHAKNPAQSDRYKQRLHERLHGQN